MDWRKEQALRPSNLDHKRDMQIVRDALYAFGDMKLLSIKTGISKSSLYAIRSGQIRWPRKFTMHSLTEVLGLELSMRHKRKGEP